MRMKTGTLLASALFLGMTLPARAQSLPPQEAAITPTQSEAGQAFELTVSGMADYCAPIFSGHTVTVSQDGSIQLGVTAQSNPAALCLPGPQPYATGFRIPALKDGAYSVFLTLEPSCLSSKPACEIAVIPLFAGLLTIGPKSPITYTIDPTRAAEGEDFSLSLLSYQFNCATSFDNLAVAVDDNTITLTFLDHEKPDMMCPAIYKPYGPVFKIAALKAGSYKVKAYRLPACHPCKMMGEVADAGVLTVGPDAPRKGWFLKDKHVYPDNPFSLQLLNEAYGNCQTSFSHQSLVVDGGSIFTRFLVNTNPEIACITDIRPHGPVFGMQGLKLGVYPVYVNELLSCEVTEPYCLALRIKPAPSDTLIVMQTLSALISDLRAKGPKAELRGSRAAITLPAGVTGMWRAEVLDAAGRKVSAGSVRAAGGARAEINLGAVPERGVYLMRLSGPDGKTHLAPLVRRD